MIVISDTSPLNYLILIECVHVLPALYGSVVIPEGVFEELQRPNTPEAVREWMSAHPNWLEVRRANAQPDAALELLSASESAIEVPVRHLWSFP